MIALSFNTAFTCYFRRDEKMSDRVYATHEGVVIKDVYNLEEALFVPVGSREVLMLFLRTFYNFSRYRFTPKHAICWVFTFPMHYKQKNSPCNLLKSRARRLLENLLVLPITGYCKYKNSKLSLVPDKLFTHRKNVISFLYIILVLFI